MMARIAEKETRGHLERCVSSRAVSSRGGQQVELEEGGGSGSDGGRYMVDGSISRSHSDEMSFDNFLRQFFFNRQPAIQASR